MFSNTALSTRIILLLQRYIAHLGFTPLIHFELEGVCRFSQSSSQKSINFSVINRRLQQVGIEGTLVPEYWQHQWEYVSDFSGQSPLKEAHNLAYVIAHLPKWFAEQGIKETLIKPVIWSGDRGKLAQGSKNIFTSESRAVHIPNAIQINVSALDNQGQNIICHHRFGEYLQQCFLQTSLACCLLYLPEEEAFERLALKEKYGLADELCSPTGISGGHQGSIALYKKQGKHNQPMGMTPLLFDQYQQPLLHQQDWRKTARIEHRLGASSTCYSPYLNVIYALTNLIDALEVYLQGACAEKLITLPTEALPRQLKGSDNGVDALSLFREDTWLNHRINQVAQAYNSIAQPQEIKAETDLGDQLKRSVLDAFSY